MGKTINSKGKASHSSRSTKLKKEAETKAKAEKEAHDAAKAAVKIASEVGAV